MLPSTVLLWMLCFFSWIAAAAFGLLVVFCLGGALFGVKVVDGPNLAIIASMFAPFCLGFGWLAYWLQIKLSEQ